VLPSGSYVSLTVHDVLGRIVRILAAETYPEGSHELIWDGRDDEERPVATGIYLCRIEANGTSRVKSIVLRR
jgi:flagellar hook assembly protein FlgD